MQQTIGVEEEERGRGVQSWLHWLYAETIFIIHLGLDPQSTEINGEKKSSFTSVGFVDTVRGKAKIWSLYTAVEKQSEFYLKLNTW